MQVYGFYYMVCIGICSSLFGIFFIKSFLKKKIKWISNLEIKIWLKK